MAKSVKTQKSSAGVEKWTAGVFEEGHAQIPKLLFRYAGELKIKPAEQALLFHLIERWWRVDHLPVVGKEVLAKQLGIQPRQVQRHIATLRKLGLIETSRPRRLGLKGQEYTFDGLVNKLENIAQERRSQKKWEDYEKSKGRPDGADGEIDF